MMPEHPVPTISRLLAAAGALLAAMSVGLAAYASHAAAPDARQRLFLAAVFAFGHGVALASLAPARTGRLGRVSLAAMLTGVLLFSGSLVAAHFLGTPTRLAPPGGTLMMLAWLGCAAELARR